MIDPGADLAIALSIVSSVLDRPLPRTLVAIGEVGLAGELRRVPGTDRRVAEAARLGFSHAIVPAESRSTRPEPTAPSDPTDPDKMQILRPATLREALDMLDLVRRPADGSERPRRTSRQSDRSQQSGSSSEEFTMPDDDELQRIFDL